MIKRFEYNPAEWDLLTDEQRAAGLAFGIHACGKVNATRAQKDCLKHLNEILQASSELCKELVTERIEDLQSRSEGRKKHENESEHDGLNIPINTANVIADWYEINKDRVLNEGKK